MRRDVLFSDMPGSVSVFSERLPLAWWISRQYFSHVNELDESFASAGIRVRQQSTMRSVHEPVKFMNSGRLPHFEECNGGSSCIQLGESVHKWQDRYSNWDYNHLSIFTLRVQPGEPNSFVSEYSLQVVPLNSSAKPSYKSLVSNG